MRIVYTRTAIDDLKAMDASSARRILSKLVWYAEQKDALSFAERLSGHNLYRFRIGMYRAVFEVSGDSLIILFVDLRDRIYKRL